MQSKLITNYLINPKRKNAFSATFSFVNLSILFAAVLLLCSACDDAERTLQDIVSITDPAEQIPSGEGLAVGITAPDFSLPDGEGSLYSLSDYRGQKLVIVFYRTGT